MTHLLLLIPLLLALLAAPQVWGATVYVKKEGTTVYYKSGASSCETGVTTAWTTGTLTNASTAASTNGTVWLCPATYSGTDIVSPVGTLQPSANGQTWRGTTGIRSEVVIDGSLSTGASTVSVNATGMTLQDLTVANSVATKYGIDATQAATYNNVLLLNNQRGVYIRTNAGGTHNRVRVTGTKEGYTLALAGTVNATTWNMCLFDHNTPPISALGAVTAAFNNSYFIGFPDLVFSNSTYDVNLSFVNSIFAANNLNGANSVVVQTGGHGTWSFASSILADTALKKDSFIGNAGGGATVTITNPVSSYNPSFVKQRADARVFLFMDDTTSISNWFTLADLANSTYRVPVNLAMYVSGTEGYSAADWQKVAGYITGSAGGNGSGVANEIACHGYSGVRLYTTAGDDAAGTVNAFTQAGGHAVTISVTRSDPDDSATWTGTAQIDSGATIDLASASYNTTNKLMTYLAANGVTVGTATGQIAYDDSSFTAKSVCLKAGTYASGSTLVFDQTSLFQVELKESKAWLESKIGTSIPGWTAKSFVWSGGAHGANAETYALSTVGYLQARGVNNIDTADYKVSSLGLYRVGSLDAPNLLGVTDADIALEAGGVFDTAKHFGAAFGIHSHGFTAFSQDNWTSLLNTARNSRASITTFSTALDWVRANQDHVTSNVSYRCADNTDGCMIDQSDYGLTNASPETVRRGGDTGVCVPLATAGVLYDMRGRVICKRPYVSIGAIQWFQVPSGKSMTMGAD